MVGLDVLLIALIVALLPVCVWKPWIGVLVFTWLGVMNPNRLVGGLAYDLPLSKVVGAATLVGLLVTRERYPLPRRREVYFVIALWILAVASTACAALEPARAWAGLAEVSKIFLMAGLTTVLFQQRTKVRVLLLVIALSIGFLGVMGGMWGIATGFQAPLFGPPDSGLADNNELGFALVVALPLLAACRQAETRAGVRTVLLAAFGLSIVAVLATYSRGSVIGGALVLVLIAVRIWTKDIALLVTGLAACAVSVLMPLQWVGRVSTITPTAYRTDGSGAKRMQSWYVAFRLGSDHPLLGAGFHPFSPAVYERYLPGYADDHDAHNHFLQVFAEQGVAGLMLFVALLCSAVVRLLRLGRPAGDPAHRWIAAYADGICIALVGFTIEGFFVNRAYFDVYLELIAVTVVLQELAETPDGTAVATVQRSLAGALVRAIADRRRRQ